jgi:hypothetical protein
MIHGNEVLLRLIVGDSDVEVPFSGSTVRDKYDVLTYEAAIEGDGLRRSLTEKTGATGGFTTSLTIDTAPTMIGVMFGNSGENSFVSGTRDLYATHIDLCAADTSKRFTLIEQFGNTNKAYPDCVCSGFELRIRRGEAVKARVDVDSETVTREEGREKKEKSEERIFNRERFNERGVRCFLHDKELTYIYGATLSADKTNGCKTFLKIHRVLLDEDLPERINSIIIRARLFRDKYEEREYGGFDVCLNDLRLISDEMDIDAAFARLSSDRHLPLAAVAKLSGDRHRSPAAVTGSSGARHPRPV